MKKLLALLLCLTMVFALAACTKKDPETPPAGGDDETPGDEVRPIKVVNLINGTLGDLSFFDSAENGMKMLKQELGDKFEYSTQELSYDNNKWEPALLDASEDPTVDVIICGTWQMQEVLEKHADEFPEKTYILYDASVNWAGGDYKNVHCIEYKQNEGSYLAGVLAASMTQSGKIGFLGGMDNPVINDFLVGYIQGAKSVKDDIKIMQSFVGNFNDSAKGAELSGVQFASGVDIGFACAGQAGLGMFEAAVNAGGKDSGLRMIGVDSDQAMVFEENGQLDRATLTTTSMLKRVDISLYRAILDYMDGKLQMKVTNRVGIEEGCIGLADNKYYQELVPDEVKTAVKAAEDEIVGGSVTVVTALGMPQDELDAYKNAVK
ncbi:MAG: BMP family ABC transporter substrate-binding protein [Clostridiales bacterium]|nr:BMP family ABC transporter substrate-binding protein [Clostridiales bacterium]